MKPQAVSGQGPKHQQPSAVGKPAEVPPAVSAGPRIVQLRPDDPSPVGRLMPRAVDGLAHGYAVQADDFAREIFALLRAPFTDESREGARELGNYRAALLGAIDAGLGPGQIEELMGKARHDAAEIAKHRKRYYRDGGSPEKCWRYKFNLHLAARRKPPAQAGDRTAAAGA